MLPSIEQRLALELLAKPALAATAATVIDSAPLANANSIAASISCCLRNSLCNATVAA